MRRFTAMLAALTGAAVTFVTFVAPVSPASAICEPSPSYSFTSVTTQWKATNLKSSYITGPGTITFSKGRSYTVSASMTATVSAEAGIVFAKASASLGITVGASYTSTVQYAYALNVASGQTRAMQQYKRAKKFNVTKYRVTSPCTLTKIYSASGIIAPYGSTAEQYFKYALVA